MTRHTIKSAFTRFVLIVSVVTSIGVGSFAIGGTADVAAMPVDCGRLWSNEYYYYGRYMSYRDSGQSALASHYLGIANYYFDKAVNNGC